MYRISATIPGHGCERDNILCFDPNIVMGRLGEAFPDVEIDPRDYSWKDYEAFVSRGLTENDGAVRVALADAMRRGPIFRYRLPVGDGLYLQGHAERYVVGVWSEEPIPEPTRSKFLEFLRSLRVSPSIEIQSLRIEGNDHTPA